MWNIVLHYATLCYTILYYIYLETPHCWAFDNKYAYFRVAIQSYIINKSPWKKYIVNEYKGPVPPTGGPNMSLHVWFVHTSRMGSWKKNCCMELTSFIDICSSGINANTLYNYTVVVNILLKLIYVNVIYLWCCLES